MAGFTPVNVAGNYLAGRRNAQDEQYGDRRNALADQAIQQNTQEMNMRAQGQLPEQQEFAAEQKKAMAVQMMQAAKFALESPTPKAFIEQNFPDIAAAAGPEWATADDNAVKAQLQGVVARMGSQAGVGPEAPKGQGAMYRYTNQQGEGVYGDATDVRGQPVYESTSEKAPPSGYRARPDGSLEPIPGGPADPATPNTRDDSRVFAKADKLRDEFNNQSKDFIAVNDAYNQVQSVAANPSAAGDLSMIFSFMKMLDPTSVVREQEFANAQNAAGVPERIQNEYNRLLKGERLNPTQRADFIKQAENLYRTRKARQDTTVKRYTEIAKRNKVNPDDVIGDMSVAMSTSATDDDAALLQKWGGQ